MGLRIFLWKAGEMASLYRLCNLGFFGFFSGELESWLK